MSEIKNETKKSSFRDVILIVGIIVVCFALTVYAIYYLFGVAMEPKDIEERPPTKEFTDPLIDNAPISITDNVTENLIVGQPMANTIPNEQPAMTPPAPIVPVAPKVVEQKKEEPKKEEPKKPVDKPKVAEPKKPADKPKTTEAKKTADVAKLEKPRVYTEKVDQSSVNKGKFVLQLMALRTEEDAFKAMEKFRVACDDIYVVRADLKDNGVWYRVRCGITDSMDEALKLKHTLANDYKINADIIKNR